MFREFIYLDTDRVQSIIAQLQQGLMTDVMSGKTTEVSGSAGLATALFSYLLPSIGGKVQTDIRQSKVVHDYAYDIAVRSLAEQHLLLNDVSDLEWEDNSIPLPEDAFILIKGTAKIVDYSSLRHLGENEQTMSMLFGRSNNQQSTNQQTQLSRQQRRSRGRQGTVSSPQEGKNEKGVFEEMMEFVNVFYGDIVQITVTTSSQVKFVGGLRREHFREDVRSLIFKYGSSAL